MCVSVLFAINRNISFCDLHFVSQEYKAGTLLTGQLKAKCIKVIQDFVKGFQDVCTHHHNLFVPPYH